ncbi:natural killer cells antigen CD94-like [Ranitomeya imitator]|uniref:natural killer cells antigen CD94-like n=1 Tax=Ranitomeya imitator TaxID=111125 RepID=UPI0037E8E851
MEETVIYAQINLPVARSSLQESKSHLKVCGRFSLKQTSVFAALLLIIVSLGICIIFLQIRASSFQCPNNSVVVTERSPDRDSRCLIHEITVGGENSSLSGCNVCSVGWLLLNQNCYYFSEDKKSWTESDQLCKSVRADLVTIKPSQIILTGYVQSLKKDFWVGLKKESRDRYPGELWYWSDNTIEETIQEENSDFCVKIGLKLMTESCSMELLRICEKQAEKC